MKLVWSPETASKAYIDTVKYCELYQNSGAAELISATVAGWNAKLIVETWSEGGDITTSIGLAIAAGHTSGRHVCIVSDDRSRSDYTNAMSSSSFTGASPDIIIGDPVEVMSDLVGIDFLLIDGRWKDFPMYLRSARFSQRGAVLVCKNAEGVAYRWRGVVDGGNYRVVRTAYLPVGQGLDVAHVAGSGAFASSKPDNKMKRKWVKHFDRRSGEEHVIRTS